VVPSKLPSSSSSCLSTCAGVRPWPAAQAWSHRSGWSRTGWRPNLRLCPRHPAPTARLCVATATPQSPASLQAAMEVAHAGAAVAASSRARQSAAGAGVSRGGHCNGMQPTHEGLVDPRHAWMEPIGSKFRTSSKSIHAWRGSTVSTKVDTHKQRADQRSAPTNSSGKLSKAGWVRRGVSAAWMPRPSPKDGFTASPARTHPRKARCCFCRALD
jgi:hypothetical protein